MPQKTVNFKSQIAYYGMVWSGTYNIIRGTQGELVNGSDKLLKWGYGVTIEEDREEGGGAPGQIPQTVPGNPRNLVLPTKKESLILGVLIINESFGISEVSMLSDGDRGIMPSTPADVLTFGDVIVPVEAGLTSSVRYGEAVSCRVTATDQHEQGIFANVDDDAHAALLNARWLSILKEPTDTVMGMGIINLGGF